MNQPPLGRSIFYDVQKCSHSGLIDDLLALQLAPVVKIKLMLAGVTDGWAFGLIQAVTPMASIEEDKALGFDSEIETIRSEAAAASALSRLGEGTSVEKEEGEVAALSTKESSDAKELVAA